MDYDRIIGLLDNYWKCETPLPEEEERVYFFRHWPNIGSRSSFRKGKDKSG